jgi:hypothetical protein
MVDNVMGRLSAAVRGLARLTEKHMADSSWALENMGIAPFAQMARGHGRWLAPIVLAGLTACGGEDEGAGASAGGVTEIRLQTAPRSMWSGATAWPFSTTCLPCRPPS